MRTLFLSPRIPYPPNRGDRIRSWHLLKHFAARGLVDLACTRDAAVTQEHLDAVRNVCRQVVAVPAPSPVWWAATKAMILGHSATAGAFHSRDLETTLEQWTHETNYDAIFVYCSSMVPYLEKFSISRERVIVDFVDVDSRKWLAYADNCRGWRAVLYRREQRCVERLERQAVARSSRILVTTELEAAIAREVCPKAVISVLKNGVDLDYFGATPPLPRTSDAAPTCIFTGVLNYPPNEQAVRWFVNEVWPGVRREFNAARFLIVGRTPTNSVWQLAAHPGVDIHADVPDVRPFFSESQVVVAPLQIARGIQNKILEGMAARRAVIASPQAAAGLDAAGGTEFLVAHDADSWQKALRTLFSSPSDRERIAAAGRGYVEQQHPWERELRRLDNWFAKSKPSNDTIACRNELDSRSLQNHA